MTLSVLAAVVLAVVDAGTPKADARVEITETVAAPTKSDHGQKIIDAIVAEIPAGTDYRIMYASAFEGKADSTGATVMDWSKMLHTMVKAKQAGATHVCTAFSGDPENSKIAADFAAQLGLTLVASMGNEPDDVSGRLWQQEGVVSVLAAEYRHARPADFVRAIDHETSGVIDANTRGSSFASARMCARLAVAASKVDGEVTGS